MNEYTAQPSERPSAGEHVDIFYGSEEPVVWRPVSQKGRRDQSSALERALAGPATNHGVAWNERMGHWMARVTSGGTVTHLGFFKQRAAAVEAFDAECAKRELPVLRLITRRDVG